MCLEGDEQLDRVRTALAGLAPDQSEKLVRMLELGAMICLVEASVLDAAVERAPSPSSRVASHRRRAWRPYLRPVLNAGAT